MKSGFFVRSPRTGSEANELRKVKHGTEFSFGALGLPRGTKTA
jgi:hypothetical protein